MSYYFKDYIIKKTNLKGYSFFCGSGGSTIGYKLAGFDMIGGCDVDKNQMEIYQKNHNPQFLDLKPIQFFLENDVEYLQNLDLIDGSPPCTNFSCSNHQRKNLFLKEKKYKEGNIVQVLESLILVYLQIVNKYKPKFFVLENVINLKTQYKDLLLNYIKTSKIEDNFKWQCIELNPSKLGSFTSRNRMFIIGIRKDIYYKFLDFSIDKPNYQKIGDIYDSLEFQKIKGGYLKRWIRLKEEINLKRIFEYQLINKDSQIGVINTNPNSFFDSQEPKALTARCLAKIQGIDYNFDGMTQTKIQYAIGMSVHPLSTRYIGQKLIKYLDNIN